MTAIANENQNDQYPCSYLRRQTEGWGGGEVIGHQKSCKNCFQWLFDNDLSKFEHVLKRAIGTAQTRNSPILHFAASKGYKVGNESLASSPLLEEILRTTTGYALPNDREKLPNSPGVYIIVINGKNSRRAAYIGSSASIQNRVTGHHLRDRIYELLAIGVEMSVHCLLFPSPHTEKAMRETENFLIREIEPSLNGLGNARIIAKLAPAEPPL